ncbi:hypothetical protein EMGBD4_16430 [Verrucomicrobiota bacterium]|nr:hypothetical protein EMGBD4_16430 [Verrucomicrobiota bacterium]
MSPLRLLTVLTLPGLTLSAAERIQFNRDIRPIFSDTCYACHGPDENKTKGKLRLDSLEAARKGGKSGDAAIVPGHPEQSAVMKRLLTNDVDDHMPPAEFHKVLSASRSSSYAAGSPRVRSTKATGRSKPPARSPPEHPGRRQRHRWLHPAHPSGQEPEAEPRGGPRDPAAPRGARPDRPASVRGRPTSLPDRPVARSLVQGARSPLRLDPLRRAHGGAVARLRALRRQQRFPKRHHPHDVAVARLGHPRLQREQAVRPIHHRATRRRPAPATTRVAGRRDRLQSQPPAQRRGRSHRR